MYVSSYFRLIEMIDDFTKEVKTTTNTSIETKNINIMVVNFTKPDDARSYAPAFRYQPQLIHEDEAESVSY